MWNLIMKLFKPFKITIGVLLLLSSIIIISLFFLEPKALTNIYTGFKFLIAMFIVPTIFLYGLIGVLTLAFKKSKTMIFIAALVSLIALFLEIFILVSRTLGEFTIIILTLHLIMDIIIVDFSYYLLVEI